MNQVRYSAIFCCCWLYSLCCTLSRLQLAFTFISQWSLPYVPSHVLLVPLVLQTVTITRTNTNIIRLNYFNSSTGTNGDVITEISIANPSQPSTSMDNTLAYRPNFADYHQSGLAGVFLNLERIFPCISDKYPICRMFTYEKDGFNSGKAIIEAADRQ